MTFGERFIGAMKLDARIFEEVEADPSAIGQSAATVVISAIADGIGNLVILGPHGMVSGAVGALIGYGIWAGLVFLIGTKLLPEPTTKADFAETFRTIGFAAAPGVVRVFGFLPVIGWSIAFAARLWMLAAMVVAVQRVLDYRDIGRAIAVCLIGFAIEFTVMALVIVPYFFFRLG